MINHSFTQSYYSRIIAIDLPEQGNKNNPHEMKQEII